MVGASLNSLQEKPQEKGCDERHQDDPDSEYSIVMSLLHA
jgi:hypothetical protein